MSPSETILGALQAAFQPTDARPVWKWAEDEVELSSRQTESPGPFSTTLTPYVREPLNAFADERVTDLSLCWGTQTAKTNSVMMGTAWRMVNRPLPTLWVMPSEDLARSFAETRWLPMVDDCKPLAAKKHPNKRKFTALAQDYQDATLHFVGSNSPANLASRPIGCLLMDEVDKFATQRGAEAGALALAENRTKSFTQPLRVKTSTPTVEDGNIWREFLRSDQRYYMVPCPHCGERQRLEWKNVKWDEDAKDEKGKWDKARVRVTARYVCPHCEGDINDVHKTKMLREGEWVATNPNAEPGRRGYHLNSLYAPWRSCSFGALAVKWLDAQSDLSLLQDFVNSTLAEPWQDVDSNVTDADVWKLRDDTYRRGEIPIQPDFLTLCADPGGQATHYAVLACKFDGEMWLVDWGVLLNPEMLLEQCGKRYPVTENGSEMGIAQGLVDSGYETSRIYDLCAQSGGILWPSKGNDAAVGSWSNTQVPSHPTLRLYTYCDHQLKLDLYIRRIKQGASPRLHLPSDVSSEFVAGLSGQQLVTARSLKGNKQSFKKAPNDHFGDCVKLAMLTTMAARE